MASAGVPRGLMRAGAFFRQANLNFAGRSSGLAALRALSLQQCCAQIPTMRRDLGDARGLSVTTAGRLVAYTASYLRFGRRAFATFDDVRQKIACAAR